MNESRVRTHPCRYCGGPITYNKHLGWLHQEPGAWVFCPVSEGQPTEKEEKGPAVVWTFGSQP